MKKILLISLVFCGITVSAQTSAIKPKEVFIILDVERQNKAIADLTSTDTIVLTQVVNNVLAKPNDYNPSVLYLLSRILFNQGYSDDAFFWFYVAQLRGRYDAYLSLDTTAKDLITALNNEYGTAINQYAFQNIDTLAKIVKSVVIFVRTNDENYDHRWISLHATDAVDKDKEQLEPKEKWPAIKKKTIDEYYDGFVNYVKSTK